jgi:hypothetical protein
MGVEFFGKAKIQRGLLPICPLSWSIGALMNGTGPYPRERDEQDGVWEVGGDNTGISERS